MVRIVSYNVNGIRSALEKGLLTWVEAVSPDVICLQEIKADPGQFDFLLFEQLGYHHYWHPAKKKGYSGVAILSKTEPVHVESGCGIGEYDAEGRVIRADYGTVSVISLYVPAGSGGIRRQAFKSRFLGEFRAYIDELKKSHPRLVICGDFNICHQPVDLHDPIGSEGSSGYLPEEKAWFKAFMKSGFVDTFRYLNSEPHHYTWWPLRPNARARNLGWRIDYQMISQALVPLLKRSVILRDAKHSDHCPVLLEIASL